MLAFRLTLKVKPGCMDKAFELAKSVKFAPDWKGRIYASGMGSYCPGDILIFEEVYESVAEREAYWGKYMEKPEFSAWWDRFNEFLEPGGSTEVWSVTEISI